MTSALGTNGETNGTLSGTASGSFRYLEANIGMNVLAANLNSIVSGTNEATVVPGVNPHVLSKSVRANVNAQGAPLTTATATGQKVRTILMEDQEPDNTTFDFGISELTFTLTGLNVGTKASMDLGLYRDTTGDGVEDGEPGWTAHVEFELVEDPVLGGIVGRIDASGAWDECDFLVSTLNLGLPGIPWFITATLRPEAKLQHAAVTYTNVPYLLISQYSAEAHGDEEPASSTIRYDVSYAPEVPFIPAEADMTAYRPMHGAAYEPFNKTAVNDTPDANGNEDEESPTLGPGIRINPQGNVDDPLGEDDLIEVTIKKDAGTDDLILERSSSNLKVYNDPLGTSEIPFYGSHTAPLGLVAPGIKTVFVEWAGSGHGTADLTVQACHDGAALDTLKFHTFHSIVVGLGGLFEEGIYNDDGSIDAGTGKAAFDLYKEGYDTFWYTHGNYESARDEIITGLTDRGVQNVVMWGYSLGGNRLRDVAQSIVSAGYGSSIKYTAYVDAIDFVLLAPWAERQKPPGSPKHDSFYQRIDPEIRGNSTVEDLEGLQQTTYDSQEEFEDAWDAEELTPVSNVDLSTEVAAENPAGWLADNHRWIDGYVYRQKLYLNRTTEIVPTR